ncbi:MAG TPA: sigma-70 family RNA polymerase sigma factor [Polyangiaceae bacterium]|jgi:RNA polymerase sigma-32 factor|nr:sigma-70 family RNA polymerase sigma factor [Polyangiaceae bacterium]
MSAERTSNDLGFYLAEAKRAPRLGREQELELALRWKQHGDRVAADVLARANLRHVVTIALKYRHYGVAVSDLIAEGNFGVVHALGKFEPERGIRFVTYSAHWVRAYMLDHIIKTWSVVGGGSGALRSRLFFRLRRERVRVTNLLGEGEAAELEIASRLGVTRDELVSMVQRLEARDLSLDMRAAPDSPVGLVDLLPAAENQEQALLELQVGGSVKSAVERALRELDPRERYIAEQRLMADPTEELSLAEIGRNLGVSRERARQLEERTKRKLRSSIPALGNAIVSEWLAPPDAA